MCAPIPSPGAAEQLSGQPGVHPAAPGQPHRGAGWLNKPPLQQLRHFLCSISVFHQAAGTGQHCGLLTSPLCISPLSPQLREHLAEWGLYQDGRCKIAAPVKAGFFKHAVRCWYSQAGCSGGQSSPMPFVWQDSEAAACPQSKQSAALSPCSPVGRAGCLSPTTLVHSPSCCCLCLQLLLNTNIKRRVPAGFCVSQQLNRALELLRDAHSEARLEVHTTLTWEIR